MTGNNTKQIVGFFLLLFACFAAVFFAFLYTTRKNVAQQFPAAAVQKQIARHDQAVTVAGFRDGATAQVSIGDVTVRAEIAASDAKKHAGLSGRSPLAKGEGMLFVFDSLGPYAFWNKDMLFPIDIAWIADGTVVDLYESMPDFASSPNFTATPKQNASFVLEVNAGFVQEHGIKVGDTVRLQ